MIQQPALAVDTARVACQRTVGTDDTVTRDDYRDRVLRVCQPNCPHGFWIPNAFCELGVAPCRASGNAAQFGLTFQPTVPYGATGCDTFPREDLKRAQAEAKSLLGMYQEVYPIKHQVAS